MADAPRKTYPELQAQTGGIQSTDLLATWRDPGPLKGIPGSDLIDFIQPSVDAAAASAATATADAISASADALAASDSADLAQMVALAGNIYPLATANVPRGVPLGAVAVTAPGSTYTNGTFALTFTGGNFSINPTGTFTVAGNVVTAITITGTGQYIGASPTAPTPTFTNSAGGSGATATLSIGFLVQSGATYLANHASDTNLYQLFNNNAGTAQLVTGATVPKNFSGVYTAIKFVRLYVSSGTSSNNFTARPVDTNTVLTGDATLYIFMLQAQFACNGSMNMAILNGDGSAFLPLTNVEAPDGGVTPINSFLTYDLLTIVRNPSPVGSNPGSASQLRLMKTPDVSASTITPVAYGIDTWGELPNVDRPVGVHKVGPNTWFMDIKPNDAQFVSPMAYDHYALTRYVLFDMGDFMSDAGGAPALNSTFARFKGQDRTFCNLIFQNLSGNTTDNGQVPSTFEPPIIVGDFAAASNTYVVAGIGHGYLKNTSWTLIGTLDGVPTADLHAKPITFTGYYDKIVSTLTAYPTTVGDVIVAKSTYTVTYEPTSSGQVTVEEYVDFADASVTITPATTGVGAYSCLVPIPGANRIQPWLNGVAGSIYVIDSRDDAVTNIGHADKVIVWNTDEPTIQQVIVNNAGLGKSYWENGVAQAITQDTIVLNNVWGPKVSISPIRALGTGKENLTGKNWRFSYTISSQVGPAIT